MRSPRFRTFQILSLYPAHLYEYILPWRWSRSRNIAIGRRRRLGQVPSAHNFSLDLCSMAICDACMKRAGPGGGLCHS